MNAPKAPPMILQEKAAERLNFDWIE